MKNEAKTQILALVISCDWNDKGETTRVKLMAEEEEVYEVFENDQGRELILYERSWVLVTGKLLTFDSFKVIDIEKISEHKRGEIV